MRGFSIVAGTLWLMACGSDAPGDSVVQTALDAGGDAGAFKVDSVATRSNSCGTGGCTNFGDGGARYVCAGGRCVEDPPDCQHNCDTVHGRYCIVDLRYVCPECTQLSGCFDNQNCTPNVLDDGGIPSMRGTGDPCVGPDGREYGPPEDI